MHHPLGVKQSRGCGRQRLPRVVGEAKALESIMSGLTFTGAEARAIGMVAEG
jgi:enoyl-CoA hydratase/carnithine racemase